MLTLAKLKSLKAQADKDVSNLETSLSRLNIKPESPTGKLIGQLLDAVRAQSMVTACIDVLEERIVLENFGEDEPVLLQDASQPTLLDELLNAHGGAK